MGCRSLSYFIYGAVSTIIWMMFLISSILAHYSAADFDQKPQSELDQESQSGEDLSVEGQSSTGKKLSP